MFHDTWIGFRGGSQQVWGRVHGIGKKRQSISSNLDERGEGSAENGLFVRG